MEIQTTKQRPDDKMSLKEVNSSWRNSTEMRGRMQQKRKKTKDCYSVKAELMQISNNSLSSIENYFFQSFFFVININSYVRPCYIYGQQLLSSSI